MKQINLPNYIRRSGAKFESKERFLNNTFVVDTTETELEHAGVPLTCVDKNVYATSKDELHCFVIGESGCGKTRRVILPTIQLMAKTGQSMVISDPKGELYRTTSSSLRDKGYAVQVLNFRNPSRGHRWNPLQRIENLYRSGGIEERDKAVTALDDIISDLTEGKEGKDPYWINCASDVFRGIALIILEYGNEGELTFENISLVGREIAKALSRPDRKFKFMQFMDSLPRWSPIVNNLSVITTNAPETRDTIISEMQSMVSLYTSQELLMDLFVRSDIDIDQLGILPTALFIVLPDDNKSLYPIATVLIKQIYSTLVSLADEQPNGELPNMVTFVLDEFANFAKMPSFDSMLTAARSRKIRFILVCQSMDQLTEKYKESGRETLLANCRIWIYMSCRNLPFLKRLQELIGYYISPYTNEIWPLIDIGNLQHFDMGQVLVLNDRCSPIIGFLEDYDKYDFGEGTRIESVLMPKPRKPLVRKQCNIETIYTKAKESYVRVTAEKQQEVEVESDGLRASIFSKKDTSDIDLEFKSLITKIDAKLAKMDDEEEKNTDIPIIEDSHYRDVMELFSQGKYYEAAQKCIDELVKNPSSSKNYLAFLIRYAELDTSKLHAPFSLSVPMLLMDEFNEHMCFAMINQALYEVQAKHYKKAVDIILKLSITDWKRILLFWLNNLWRGKDKDPEGALVCMIARIRGVILDNITEAEYQEMGIVVADKYGAFITSNSFIQLKFSDDDEDGAVTESTDDMSESIIADDLFLLLDDDALEDDEVEDADTFTTKERDSLSVEDIQLALEKKINEKLDIVKIDTEEE